MDMKPFALLFTFWLALFILFSSCQQIKTIEVMQWDEVTLDFEGPEVSESDDDNPFLNYRLDVTFTNGSRSLKVPGYFAADGMAGETSAAAGKTWRVHFRPDTPGKWNYVVSFRKGENIAVSDDPEGGAPVFFDGAAGSIEVATSNWPKDDTRARGKLMYTGGRYLTFKGSGGSFLKGGADSPENLLGYADFDGTERGEIENREGEAAVKENLHRYEPHIKDWKEGDPTWRGGKGKGIIGGLNYLRSKGVNSVYFLTMNIGGDGKDVWPYTGYEERLRFDCSKLDQWEIVFDHMDKLGLMLHVVTQETENEKLLDDGDTKFERKLYYRELIARFSHHLAVTWNMGEENGPADFSPNGQTIEQQKAMVEYFKSHDPYQNFTVIHTHANPKHRYEIFEKLVGDPNLDGPSIQIGRPASAHEETKVWLKKSGGAGKQWVVNIDEIGPAWRGVDPDDREINNQDSVRYLVLWGNLMAGGGGAEWYFGYKNHNNDLGCEDWRSRDRMWDYTRYAINFFHEYLPFTEMQSADELISDPDAFCFAKSGEIYAIYKPFEGKCELDLSGYSGQFSLKWYNPRSGGPLVDSSITSLQGGSAVELGDFPGEIDEDWVALVRKND
jgi:hypothetical protein